MTLSSSSTRAARARARRPARVALLQRGGAGPRQLGVGLRVLRARVGVAQVAGQVEHHPLGQPARLLHRVRVLGEAGGHGLRRGQRVRGVAAPLGLALVHASCPGPRPPSRPAAACARASGRARCRWPRPAPPAARPAGTAAGCGGGRGGRRGAGSRSAGARCRRCAAATARRRRPRRGAPPRSRARHGAVAGAARQAHQARPRGAPRRLVGGDRIAGFAIGARARVRVRLRDQPAQVAIALPGLAQQRQVRAVLHASSRRR